jgi:hypothetical protein
VGFWSRDNEAWYQKRLSEYSSGENFLANAAGWKKYMTTKARQVPAHRREYEKWARRAIQKYVDWQINILW